MKLSTQVADKIINDILFRQKLGSELQVTDAWVKVLAQQNKSNGPLTTYGAIKVIQEETKMEISQILIDEDVPQLSK